MKPKRYFPYLAPMLVLFFLLFPLQNRINRLRVEEELIETDIFAATTPSDVWGVLLLAGFRGVAVNLLWMRAMELQQEKKFFELLSLHRLITALQPRFVRVWLHATWNMAYNISHEMETVEEKWKWIQKGMALLERGIQRNPKSWDLPFYRGWLYFHKVEAVDAEGYYVERLKEGGKDNLKEAIYWFGKAVEVEPHLPDYVRRMMGRAWERLVARAEGEGNLEKRDEYRKEALRQWEENVRWDPQDTLSQEAYHYWKKIVGGDNP